MKSEPKIFRFYSPDQITDLDPTNLSTNSNTNFDSDVNSNHSAGDSSDTCKINVTGDILQVEGSTVHLTRYVHSLSDTTLTFALCQAAGESDSSTKSGGRDEAKGEGDSSKNRYAN
jgi:hypothetical protein